MNPTTILIVIIAILCFNYVLDKVMDYLNNSRLDPELPESLTEFYEEGEYKRSLEYLKAKSRFGFLSSSVSFVATLLVIALGLLGALDDTLREYITDPRLLALAYFGILMVAGDLLSIPFSYYNTFVIEERFGFNKTTIQTFILDRLKGYLAFAVLGGGILFLLLFLIDSLQENFWIWFWIAISVIQLGMQYLYTLILLPIFNKLTPLEAGELRTAIEAYCKTVDFSMGNIMVMDGSKRSSKANAFFTGFGATKKVVLYDTLIEQLNQDELVAVLAHEVGHYKKKHIVQGMVIGILNMGVLLFILSRLVFEPALSTALGASQPGIHLSLLTFSLLYTPISQLTGLLFNLLSRKNEYEADDFAKRTYNSTAMSNALIKLHVKTLSNLRPHPAYVFVNYSHPTMLQRIDAMKGG